MTSRSWILAAPLGLALAFTGCVDAGPSDFVATDRVVIPGAWVFEPANIEVVAGSQVTFQNRGGAEHTVTFSGLPIDLILPASDSGAAIFDTPGTYTYVCKYHPPDMAGIVRVLPASEGAAS